MHIENDGISIRLIDFSEDIPKIIALFSEAFGEDRACIWQLRWQWQFLDTPGARIEPPRIWVAELDDDIVGATHSLPLRVKVGGEEVIAHLGCDIFTAARARRRGLGQRLMNTYLQGSDPLAIGRNYQSQTGRFLERAGFVSLDAQPVLVQPRNLLHLYDFLSSPGRLPKPLNTKVVAWGARRLLPALDVPLRMVNKARAVKASSEIEVDVIASAEAELDDLWRRLEPQFPVVVVRDREFVGWRFFDDPVLKHVVLGARDDRGTLLGYAALCLCEKRRLRLAKIMDLFCPPDTPSVADSLIERCLSIATEQNVDAITCVGLHPALRDRVARALYLRPRHLQSATWVYWTGAPAANGLACDERAWHLSHADGDEAFWP